ncbi:MAG TPA: hypothetical protein VFW11_14670 [Cyclobacteriaceae bacterium]|nr:hypothetical protein [Cyclobacteriaceae bacterium]
MKKVFLLVLVLVEIECSRSPVTEEKEKDTTATLVNVDSITYTRQRMLLADELDNLVDSIDEVLVQVRKDCVSNPGYREYIDNLEYTKDRVERDLQEINTTSLKGWDADYVKRIELNTDNNRRMLSKVKSEISSDN